jgi:enolase
MLIINEGCRWQSTDAQEFMVMPLGASSFAEGLRWGVEVYQALRAALKKRGYSTLVGDEGGYAPTLKANAEAVEVILEAIAQAGLSAPSQMALALDPAASELYDAEKRQYNLRREGRVLDGDGMIRYWAEWVRQYPIVSIEDGLAQDDWPAWQAFTGELGDRIQIVGDDLLVTNPMRVRRAVDERSCNALLAKVNQIGTLTEAMEAIGLARQAGWRTVISHRSGETEDTTIADLAVGLELGQIKTGAPARSDRVAKYNQLLRIEEELGRRPYAEWEALAVRGRPDSLAAIVKIEDRRSKSQTPPERLLRRGFRSDGLRRCAAIRAQVPRELEQTSATCARLAQTRVAMGTNLPLAVGSAAATRTVRLLLDPSQQRFFLKRSLVFLFEGQPRSQDEVDDDAW